MKTTFVVIFFAPLHAFFSVTLLTFKQGGLANLGPTMADRFSHLVGIFLSLPLLYPFYLSRYAHTSWLLMYAVAVVNSVVWLTMAMTFFKYLKRKYSL